MLVTSSFGHLMVQSVIKTLIFKKDTINILQNGAVADGMTLNTKSIQQSIDACNKKGGGVVLIPNGLWLTGPISLKSNVNLHHARKNSLPNDCISWIENANHFCNTLVDRIVPGTYINKKLPYDDKLMIMAEPFSLWAIEIKDDTIADKLSFATIDQGIVLAPSIEKFKKIKLRLGNGICYYWRIGHIGRL